MKILLNALSKYNIEHPTIIVSHERYTRWGSNNRYWAKAIGDGYVFGDWGTDLKESVFPESETKLSKETVEKRKDEIKRAFEHAEVDRLEEWNRAAQRASEIWNATSLAPKNHPYLLKKGIQPHGIHWSEKDNRLLIPLFHKGKVCSGQIIYADGTKRFISGSRTKGAYAIIGGIMDTIVLCEGFATGASIHESTGYTAICAMNVGNLMAVADELVLEYPNAKIIVAADNDIKENDINIGVQKVQEVANKWGFPIIIPTLPSGEKCDFNDIHVKEGLNVVKSFFDNIPSSQQQKTPIPQGYRLTKEYLFWTTNDGEYVKISRPIEVVAKSRDEYSKNWGKILKFKDSDGVEKEIAIPDTMFAGDCKEIREILYNEGLEIMPTGKGKLGCYLMSCNPMDRVLCINKTGWYKDAYVLPDNVIGNRNDRVRFQSENMNNVYKIKGNIDEWREKIGSRCVGNSRLIFAVSAAFASMLLEPTGLEGGGFHFMGNSSCGKSTTLKVAASVFGGPDYLRSWRITDNGLESIASMHNDTLLVLDEMGQVDPSKVGEIAYMLANGAGKTRADKTGRAKPVYAWSLLFLSSGETELSSCVEEGKKQAKAGQEVRLLTIPAVPNKDSFGMFENLHGFDNGDKLSKYLCAQSAHFYGTPARKFLEFLVVEKDSIKQRFEQTLEAMSKSILPENASEQDRRILNRFALVAFAGEYATEKGLTDWQDGDAINAAIQCFNDCVQHRGGFGNQEGKKLLDQVKYFFEQNGESRFYDLDYDKNNPVINMAGYKRRNFKGEIEYLALTQTFDRDICKGFNKLYARKVLFDAGWTNFPKPKQIKIKKKNGRFHVFNETLWDY